LFVFTNRPKKRYELVSNLVINMKLLYDELVPWSFQVHSTKFAINIKTSVSLKIYKVAKGKECHKLRQRSKSSKDAITLVVLFIKRLQEDTLMHCCCMSSSHALVMFTENDKEQQLGSPLQLDKTWRWEFVWAVAGRLSFMIISLTSTYTPVRCICEWVYCMRR